MKWTLILRLSLIGFALALVSIFFTSPNLEPVLWLAVFLYYAYAIGKYTPSWRFLHGLLVGILSSIWVVGTRDVFLARYLIAHPREVAMMDMLHANGIAASPRLIMSFTGLTVGLLEGIVIGVFAIVAGMMIRPRRLDLTARPDLAEPDTKA